ncbi:MAG TPA: hypothetical protein VNS32_00085, partial [Flavisolibacter sp.]|nr:hypothetical protein [Flavisolibacter sp.]
NNEISIVLNFPKRNGNSNIAWTQASLNSSLNEIWKGATNNRLITMDLSNQLLYYSTGIKSTFGTYRIQAVLYNGRGVYKILTQAGKQFQAFLLRSPRRNSFELSVCSTRYNSMSELQAASDTVCNPYDVMTLYYETDANKIFLPLNTNNLLEASNQSKLQRLNTPVQSAKSPYGNAKISGRLYYNSRFKWKIPDRLPIQITQTIPIQGATPFDRSYITYTSNRAASDYPSDNLNTTGYEQNAYPALSTPPNLISPAEGQTFNIIPRTTRLVWNSVRGASAYKVEIEYGYASKSQELTWTAFGKPVTVKDTTYSFEFGGAQPGRWRVSTINANTNASSPSPWRTFNFLR